MIWFVAEEQVDQESKRHAGGKAREDLSSIFNGCGYKKIEMICPQQERITANKVKKVLYHVEVLNAWRNAFKQVSEGDAVILQFPVINHTLLLNKALKEAKKRNIRCIALIHDLELLRFSKLDDAPFAKKWRIKLEELDELHMFDKLIVHNEKMKNYIHQQLNIPLEKMIVLKIFDYLMPEKFKPFEAHESFKSVIIAGNLSRNKSAYVYSLPEKPDFEMYGINFEGEYADNIHYHGSFLPDELPFYLKGGFGLVWDGDSSETCSGVWGEYLQYNNPHKTSLYLSCGIPVVIWSKAALADYVLKNKAGIVVDSLYDIDSVLSEMTFEEYAELKHNAEKLSPVLRNGLNTKRAVEEAINNRQN